MIVLGAYPDSFGESHQSGSPLADLVDILPSIVPPSVGLHLLPFYPSSGDFGFAPEDWFTVRRGLGTWVDVRRLAHDRRLMVEGIYNHVGLGHRFTQEFFRAPQSMAHIFYAYQTKENLDASLSPRGGSVLRRHVIKGEVWQTWQTFSDSSMDIRLDDPTVHADIERHLRFLAAKGIWGVRLDGCAYFGKRLGEDQFHHQDAIKYARRIADQAKAEGLQVMAQLDSDPEGLKYFPPRLNYNVPTVDYAYSAVLVGALLSADVASLVDHLRLTWNLGSTVIRPPRTHDGILLVSDLLGIPRQAEIAAVARSFGLKVRICNGEEYELNDSMPYICSLGVDRSGMWGRLHLITALSSFIPGWCYLYLPMLMGAIPERSRVHNSDPRALNRQPISMSDRRAYLTSPAGKSTYSLLSFLCGLRKIMLEEIDADSGSIEMLNSSIIRISRPGSRLQLLCNFHPQHSLDVDHLSLGTLMGGRRIGSDRIEPLGFGVWRK